MHCGLQNVLDYLLGRTPRVKALRAVASRIDESKSHLRTSVNKLGEDVFRLVETGDPLRALVHGARRAQFQHDLEMSNAGNDEWVGKPSPHE